MLFETLLVIVALVSIAFGILFLYHKENSALNFMLYFILSTSGLLLFSYKQDLYHKRIRADELIQCEIAEYYLDENNEKQFRIKSEYKDLFTPKKK